MSGYLIHYGVLGMKWGVRRYENPDGTLTEAGKRRYFQDENGKYHKIKGRSLKARTADRVSRDLELIEKTDSRRMSKMSKRQKESFYKAKEYWDKRASGEKTPRRSLIKRSEDRYRSRAPEERYLFNYYKARRKANDVIRRNSNKKLSELRYSDREAMDPGRQAFYSMFYNDVVDKIAGHF